MTTKKIGLLLSDEDDWPVAFEQLHARFKPNFAYHGATLTTEVERIRIHPFNLRAPTTSFSKPQTPTAMSYDCRRDAQKARK